MAWLAGYNYRREKPILGSTVGAMTDYQLAVTLVAGTLATAPVLLGTSTATLVYASQRRQSFYANGRFWIFYCDGANMVYQTSVDGTTWKAKQTIRVALDSTFFSVFFDSYYFHYAYCLAAATVERLYYRRGYPNPDGSIIWSAAEQTVVAGDATVYSWFPTITVDTLGYVWIGYRRHVFANPATSLAYVTKNSKTDGTWTTDAGFPYNLTAVQGIWYVFPIRMASGKVMVGYWLAGARGKSKVYTPGVGWGAELTISVSNAEYQVGLSAANDGDIIHLVFLKAATFDLVYVQYNAGWGAEVVVQAATTNLSMPQVSFDSAAVYCFWAQSPVVNHIYYKKYVAGAWDAGPTDWITDVPLSGGHIFNTFYESYGFIGILYSTAAGPPYNVKFFFLEASCGTICLEAKAQYGFIDVRFASDAAAVQSSFLTDIVSNKYASNPLAIPQYGANGVVHPDVIYFPAGMDGYTYWMVYTPYPPAASEIPCIVRSNDGITWTDAGIANPVIALGADDCVADPDFIYVSSIPKWFMVYPRQHHGPPAWTQIYLAFSNDGKVWTEYGILIDGSVAYEKTDIGTRLVQGCTLIYEGGWFYLWYSAPNGDPTINNGYHLCLAKFQWDNGTSSVINFSRDAGNPVFYPAWDQDFKPGLGHIDVSKGGSVYYMHAVRELADAPLAGPQYFELDLFVSLDKTTWTRVGKMLSRGPSGTWESYHIYRSCPVVDQDGNIVKFSNQVKLYYSAYIGVGGIPKIGLVTASMTRVKLWTKFDNIPASPASGTFYIYYGKNNVVTNSNPDNTFALYDHFGGTLGAVPNAAKWSVQKKGSVLAVVQLDGLGRVQLAGQAGVTSSGNILSLAALPVNNLLIEITRQVNNQYYRDLSIGTGAVIDQSNLGTDWWHTVLFDSYVFFIESNAAGDRKHYKMTAGVAALLANTGLAPAINLWWMERHIYLSDGRLISQFDGTNWLANWLENVDVVHLALDKYLLLSQGEHGPTGNGGDTLIDYVIVRTYCLPEPTFGLWGPEELPTLAGASKGGSMAAKMLAAGAI